MTQDRMIVGLKPVNFFSGNPSLDVAPSSQEKNKAVIIESVDDTKGSLCCSWRP